MLNLFQHPRFLYFRRLIDKTLSQAQGDDRFNTDIEKSAEISEICGR